MVCRFKGIEKVHEVSMMTWDDAELSWLFVDEDFETLVLVEIVEEEYPKVDIVYFEGVHQDAIVGILSVRSLCPLLQWDECQS